MPDVSSFAVFGRDRSTADEIYGKIIQVKEDCPSNVLMEHQGMKQR